MKLLLLLNAQLAKIIVYSPRINDKVQSAFICIISIAIGLVPIVSGVYSNTILMIFLGPMFGYLAGAIPVIWTTNKIKYQQFVNTLYRS